jgi:hypothetical protein
LIDYADKVIKSEIIRGNYNKLKNNILLSTRDNNSLYVIDAEIM